MTLEAYDLERLDRFSLRFMDICARMRNLARQARHEQLPQLELHDRKALEWLEKLEDWLDRAESETDRQVRKARGQKKARQVLSEQAVAPRNI